MAPDSYYHIVSQRFKFRKVLKTDIESWLPFFTNNPNLRFLGIDMGKTSLQHAHEWIDRQLDRYSREGFGHLAIIDKNTNEFVGMGGIIMRVVDGKDCFEIAYSVIPKYWGKGFATEIAKTLLAYGEDNRVATQFISMIHPENLASKRVAEKSGMNFIRTDIFSNIPVNIFGTSITC